MLGAWAEIPARRRLHADLQRSPKTSAQHSAAESLGQLQDCLSHIRAYGLPAEGKKRWCLGCSKAYPGAINVKNDRSATRVRRKIEGNLVRKRTRVAWRRRGTHALSSMNTPPGSP